MRRLVFLCLLGGCSSPHWSAVQTIDGAVPLSVTFSGSAVLAVGGGVGASPSLSLVVGQPPQTNPGQPSLWWLYAPSSNDQWWAGEQGTIVHDGATEASGTMETLYGIWGASDDDLWAVGGTPGKGGVILHRLNGNWQSVPSPVAGAALFKVWGTASNDVFICGEGGTILHFDGNQWTPQPTGLPPSVTLFTVNGRSSSDVYAVGGLGHGVVMHYDGASWSMVSDPALAEVGSLAGVAVDGDGTVSIVGEGGIKLHGKPGALVDDSAAEPHDDLHATAIRNGEIFVVGGNYEAPVGTMRQGVVGRYGD